MQNEFRRNFVVACPAPPGHTPRACFARTRPFRWSERGWLEFLPLSWGRKGRERSERGMRGEGWCARLPHFRPIPLTLALSHVGERGLLCGSPSPLPLWIPAYAGMTRVMRE